jgi:hypothetical protein
LTSNYQIVTGQALQVHISNDDLSDPLNQFEHQFNQEPSPEIEAAIVKKVFGKIKGSGLHS